MSLIFLEGFKNMSTHSKEMVNQFFNALQLSIDSTLAEDWAFGTQGGDIFFSKIANPDPRLKLMEKLLPGQWGNVGNQNFDLAVYIILNFDKLDLPLITNFLMLTRLDKKNIRALGQQDARFLPLCEKLGFKAVGNSLESTQEFAAFLRAKMNQQGITIQKLAEQSGLTPLSINKFRKGSDIKLSNLIKIMQALGHRLKIE